MLKSNYIINKKIFFLNIINIDIITLGNLGVGKTSFINRFMENKFEK